MHLKYRVYPVLVWDCGREKEDAGWFSGRGSKIHIINYSSMSEGLEKTIFWQSVCVCIYIYREREYNKVQACFVLDIFTQICYHEAFVKACLVGLTIYILPGRR